MFSRREFLKTSSVIALAPTVPAFVAQTARAAGAEKENRILVVVQMSGGNDGINTVVPFKDEGYAKYRDQLRLPTDELLKLNDEVALHPSMKDAVTLWDDEQLSIVQGVGYPNPNRSHAVSMAIWQSARFDREEHDTYGWIGRALDADAQPSSNSPASLLSGDEETPLALRGRRSVATSLYSLDELSVPPGILRPPSGELTGADDLTAFLTRRTVDAFATGDWLKQLAGAKDGGSYPATRLAARLQLVAQLIKAGLGTRVYYAVQPGYDTHAAQRYPHSRLLRELSGALKAFQNDLTAGGLDDRVLVMCFSEFGRRVQENGSAGTDHGTAGPLFLVGSRLRAGLHGKTPALSDLDKGDLRHNVDFRTVYAALLEDWLGISAAKVLDGEFPPLALFS